MKTLVIAEKSQSEDDDTSTYDKILEKNPSKVSQVQIFVNETKNTIFNNYDMQPDHQLTSDATLGGDTISIDNGLVSTLSPHYHGRIQENASNALLASPKLHIKKGKGASKRQKETLN